MDIEMFSQSDTQLISKCQQGYVGVSTWWYIEELMGEHASDYVFLPVLSGPDGTKNVTIRTGGGTGSGQLSITSACQSPANLLKFYDQWYDGEAVMQLQYGPIGVFFTDQDIHFGQNFDRPQGDIIGISDRNGYNIQCVFQTHAIIINPK